MVGRRGEAPLVPPYSFRRPNKAMALRRHRPSRRSASPLRDLAEARQWLVIGADQFDFIVLKAPLFHGEEFLIQDAIDFLVGLILRAAEIESFNRMGNAPRVEGKTGSNVARRAGRCPRG